MRIDSILKKIKKYGVKNSFYRVLLKIASSLSAIYPYYLFRKYLFGYAIIEINRIKMYLDLKNDEGLAKELFILGKREPLTVDYLLGSGFLKRGDIALDIGANIGYYALLEAGLVGGEGKVYAIEPVSKNLQILNKNIELNGIDNIKTYKLAVGDKDDTNVSINVRSKGNLSSITEVTPDVQARVVSKERAGLVTVDKFSEREIGKFPDFVRMDVEGYEYAILEGMKNAMKTGTRLLVEFHPMLLSVKQKERICELIGESYNRVTVTINPKPRVHYLVNFLNKKLGTESKRAGLVEDIEIKRFRELLFSSQRVFNTFIYRA